MHEEFGGLDIELFVDTLADLDPRLAALPASAAVRFVAVLNARQMRQLQGQGLDLEVLLLDLGVLGLQFGILGLQLRDRLIGLLEQSLHGGRHPGAR
jgi:hypothetical protein